MPTAKVPQTQEKTQPVMVLAGAVDLVVVVVVAVLEMAVLGMGPQVTVATGEMVVTERQGWLLFFTWSSLYEISSGCG
jgi:hypothetical protein